MLALQSSNPVLANEHLGSVMGEAEASSNTATVMGVVNKTSLLVGIAVVAGSIAYALTASNPALTMVFWAVSGLVSLVMFFVLWRKPAVSAPVAFIYSIVQGCFLGSLSNQLESILVAQGISVAGGSLALQAFVVTAGVTLATLALYRAGILRPTRMFNAIVTSLVGGIAMTYMISIVLMLVGIQMPFLSLGSALQGGTPALIGLGLNAAILIVAALTLVMDFGQIESAVANRAPKSMEWFLSFGLVVSLAWIYFEALKMVFRVAVLLNNRK